MSDSAYVAAFLKQYDPDRYYASLVLPEPARRPVQAIWAFAADAAAVADRVRDATAGEIRLQWWRDAIRGQGHGSVAANPLAAALLDAIAAFGIPSRPFLELLDARSFDLYADPMPDMVAFEGYAGATASVPLHLAAMVLNGGRPVEPGDAAGFLGVAAALTGHLRAFGYNARRGRIFLPWALFQAAGVTRDEVLGATVSERLLVALDACCDHADDYRRKASSAIAALPPRLRPALASFALVGPDLAAVRRSLERPFDVPPRRADWRRIGAMAWWAWRNG